MPSLLSCVASVLELTTDSTRCVVAMSFSRLCSLCKNSRRHIEGRVFSCSSFSEHLLSLFFLSQGMRCGFLRRPHSIFMCQCFHCCSSRNEQRDEKCFCSDSLALCVWQTFVLGKFARQMVVITVVISKPSCVSSIVWSALTRIFQGLVWAVGCFLPRASTLRMRLADDLGLGPSLHESVRTTYGRRRLFLALCSMWQKVMVATYGATFSNENGDACDVFWSADCVGVVFAFAGTLRGLWSAYLLQCMHLCPSSSETRSVTCLICELWR